MSVPTADPPFTAEYLAASKGPRILAVLIVPPALALIVVFMRLYTRVRIAKKLSHEDVVILLAMTFSIACAVCQCFQVHHGMGRHIQALTFDQISGQLKALFASIICYSFGITMTKVSIVLQYLRIAIEKPIRRTCWGLLCFTIADGVVVLITGIFQCFPIAKFWNPRLPGVCVNTAALYYANSGFNIIQDLALVVLPFFILRKLILPKREKFTLMLILGLGGIAAIASICRIQALYILDTTSDITWDSNGAATWSSIEMNVGIFCASLPTLRPLVMKYWPRAFLSAYVSRRNAAEPDYTGNGQYYNMEGSIMVRKTIAIQTSKSAGSGDAAQKDTSSIGSLEAGIRSATPDSQCGLSTIVTH
ncbi:hypothetical protein BKA66DRAFT_25531 [Pyrenochaeta sp. MPI-SDFR-AT-0127]|nr:hypothetical protein BKA66DRAFT_25531 [Pyrenochaeta sp. MPI-SDFR-AT-0127]